MVLLIIAVGVGVYLVGQSTEFREKAAPATTILLSPSLTSPRVGEEFSVTALINTAQNQVIAAELYLNFDAKEVFLVMRSKQSSAKVKVYLDDKVHYLGEDNINGVVTVDRDRLYKLIKLDIPGKHLLRLEFEDNNVEIYAFTFG